MLLFGRSSEDCGGFSGAVHARRHILVRSTSETVLACLNESRSRKSGRPETPRSPLIPEPEVRGFAWKLSICSSSRIEALSFEIPFLNHVSPAVLERLPFSVSRCGETRQARHPDTSVPNVFSAKSVKMWNMIPKSPNNPCRKTSNPMTSNTRRRHGVTLEL